MRRTCLLFLALLISACSDHSYDRLRQARAIRIGYAVEAPYAFLLPDGSVTGESPEIARAIVRRLGIEKIEWVQVEFGSLLSGLNAGRFDVIAAGMFITPERAGHAAFSLPTFRVSPGLLVRKGNPRHLGSYEQACSVPGIHIAVLSGSVEESLLRSLGCRDTNLVIVPDARTGKVAVEESIADALALSLPTLRWMLMQEDSTGDTEIAPHAAHGASGHGGFAFRLEDTQLHDAWNAQLRSFIGSSEHRQLIRRFGFTDEELPDSAQAASATGAAAH
ncbi:MAG: ectoine/hydroxyectoine ABC transporter substrate-binding protein EhuB [Acidobacteriota bacterium]